MKLVKILTALMFAAIFLLPEKISAGPSGDNDPAALADLRNKPAGYVACGTENTSYQIDRTSLNVLKYAPPEYIIAVNLVCYSSNGLKGDGALEMARTLQRQYRYNYNERRMYVKRSVDSGAAYWTFIDPKIVGTLEGYKNDWDIDMAAGEIAFYLAYGMSFFDKPVSKLAQDFILK